MSETSSDDDTVSDPPRIVIFSTGSAGTGVYAYSTHQGNCDSRNVSLGLNLDEVLPLRSDLSQNIKDIAAPEDIQIVSPDGTMIAEKWADLWGDLTGSLDSSLYDAGIIDDDWWSGADIDGITDNNCDNHYCF